VTPEQWQQVNELFKSALGRAPGERSAFLNQACSGDDSLRCEVESLIDSYEQEESFLERPAVAAAAHSLLGTRDELLVGQVVGRYQVAARIEGGGQGEVYLARDTRLGRQVALKLLPGYMSQDAERLRRFEQEARAASALNHPNVCVIHEVSETEDGLHYIVMEYVEGVTLRQHMARRRMEFPEVLDVARQVASGLAAAHAVGVVHRDIKPENIMLRTDGYVRVLDFGLAKLTEQQVAKVFTATAAMAGVKTDTGIMGTVGYMSPEQARGQSVDHRTDVFSLGVVIYEMVAGRAPFEIKTPGGVIVPIPQAEPPPLSDYRSEVPAGLELIVSKALRKDRDERYQTVAELLTDLKSVKSVRTAKLGFTARRLTFLAAVIVLTIGGSLWFYASRHSANSLLPPMKYVSFTSFPGWEGNPAFSPEGNQIAFDWSGEKDDNSDIYVMPIGSAKPLRLTTDPAADYGPTWSPDGKQIAFVRVSESEIAIYTVTALSGPERKLLSLGPKADWGGWVPDLDWSPDGKYIACVEKRSRQLPPNIFVFSPETSARRKLTSPAALDLGDHAPVFSPDSRTVAFVRSAAVWSSDIYLVSVTGGEPKRLTFDNVPFSRLAWTADGREIVFSSTRAGGDFSLWRISASGGTPERLAVGGHYVPGVSISRQASRLAYVQWSGDFNIYRTEISDSTGSGSLPIKLTASTRLDYAPQYSPDGKRIVFQSDRSGSQEIWMCDSDGSKSVQVTTLGKWAGTPRWSPDGEQITFDLYAEGRGDVYVVSAEGGLPRSIVTGDSDDNVPSWSRDGRWIYFASNRTGERQVWKVPAEGGEAVQVTRQGGGLALESADGKHVYYVKDSAPGIWRVPVGGGEEVQIFDSFNSEYSRNWAVVNDGIYFINPDAKDGAAIEFFDFATRKVKQIAGLGKVAIDFWAQGIAVSPDRRQILYAQNDQAGGDIMLVENFR
jgi:Tol biopolymer transport system component